MVWPPEPLALVLPLLCLALTVWPAPSAAARNRLRRLATQAELARHGGGSLRGVVPGAQSAAGASGLSDNGASVRRALVFAGLAGSAVLATFPTVVGALIAVVVAGGCYLLLGGFSSTEPPGSGSPAWLARLRRPRGRAGLGRDADGTLPFAIDLLAVCLRSGMPTSLSMRSVASNLSSPGSDRHERRATPTSGGPGVCVVLARVAAATELGSEPATAWEEWIGHPSYGPLARALVVTGESGSAVASRLEAVSHQLRVASGQQATVRAQRAGVALMAPLGLCFLPAFVCLGVVPVVVGIAGRVFG